MLDNKYYLDLEYNQDFLSLEMEHQGVMKLFD